MDNHTLRVSLCGIARVLEQKTLNCSINFVHSKIIKDIAADVATMGSSVRCGATLIPHSYCDVCQDVLCFVGSSCLMFTDDRIHAYCHDASNIHNRNNMEKIDDDIMNILT